MCEKPRFCLRQVKSTIANFHRILVVKTSNFISIFFRLVLLHFTHLMLGTLIEVQAIIISEEKLSSMGAYRTWVCTTNRFYHTSLRIPFTENCPSYSRCSSNQQSCLIFGKREWLFVGFVGKRTMFKLHSEPKAAGTASHHRFKERKIPSCFYSWVHAIWLFFISHF